MSDSFFVKLIHYETGDLGVEDSLDLFAELIKTGMAWKLQGSYGRTAQSMIDAGYINEAGTLTEKATSLIDEEQ